MDVDKGRVKENKRSTAWGGTRKEEKKGPKDWENTKSRNQTQFSSDCFMLPTPLVLLFL